MVKKLQRLKRNFRPFKSASNNTEIPGYMLAFTFFYAIAFYILLLSFYFWNAHPDLEPQSSKR